MKIKFKELSRFWKGTISGLTVVLVSLLVLNIWYFATNIAPLMSVL